MDVLEAIRSRRSIHLGFFTDRSIPDEAINTILDAGRWAPSAANNQPVEFLVVREEESRRWIVDQALEVMRLTSQVGRAPYRKAIKAFYQHLASQEFVLPPLMIVIMADQDKAETHVYNHGGLHIWAASAAVQNIFLAAWSLGIGGVWLSFYDDVRVKARFGIPTEMDLVGIVLLGYPKAVPRIPPGLFTFGPRLRRPLEDIVHQERFDEERFRAWRKRDPYTTWLDEEERQRLVEGEQQQVRETRKRLEP
ncbi:MAG: nitroreductase family protein [Dehalococcoidia bacterium]|nr:nitroreductase family protein [Dehalococcoidia bacterium]